jgi:hypothetical protein
MIYETYCKDALSRLRQALCLSGLLVSLAALPAYGQQIHELYFNGSQWTDQGLNSGEANWYSGIAGFATTPNDQLHVYYPVGGPGDYTDIHQLFYNGTSWSDQDLTALVGAPPATETPMAGFSVGNFQYVFYNSGGNAHVHQLLYNNLNWTDSDLTAITGAPMSFDTALVAFSTNPAIHVFFMDMNMRIHQLFSADGTNWEDQDLTSITGGTIGSENSPLNGIAAFNVGN